MIQTKGWQDWPTTTTPRTAAAYRAMEQRVANWAGQDGSIGPGVAGFEDFRVKQRSAGANMSVDVGLAGSLNVVFVPTDGVGGAQRYEYAGGQLNVAVTPADPTNPRIDVVVAEAPIDPDSTAPRVFVIAGTPTGGTTLDTRAGAPVTGATRTLLADLLVSAGAASVPTANIRNRRALSVGVLPSVGVQRDEVGFLFHPDLVTTVGNAATPTTHDTMQAVALAYLPRRIVGANRIRWKYRQGATPATTLYALSIYDTSGRFIVGPSAAFTGAANATVEAAVTIAATTFDAGWYFVGIGLNAITAASAVTYQGVPLAIASTSPGPSLRNLAFRSATGAVSMPSSFAATFTDVASLAADTAIPPVPLFSVSVG